MQVVSYCGERGWKNNLAFRLKQKIHNSIHTKPSLAGLIFSLISVLNLCVGCRRDPPTIAVIPQTIGTSLWSGEYSGASSAAQKLNFKIYWNAPTREDDVEGQIALVEKALVQHNCRGLVLTPNQSLALITPVRRAVASGIPTVITSTPLAIPPGPRLAYVLNDDEEGGRIAALHVGKVLHGAGSVAVMGIDPGVRGVMTRARSFESTLTQFYPGIKIIAKRLGSYNGPQEQQVAEEVLRRSPAPDVIVSLTSAATLAAFRTITDMRKTSAVKLIGFDQDIAFWPVQTGEIDAVIVQDTYGMGEQAIQLIAELLQHKSVPLETKLKPMLVTRDNLDQPEIQHFVALNWGLPQ